ncbi:MAG: hypothetical protein Q8P81_00910, partial [Nanoarchaeota archaeon]|nr:hypothetical protein [Nanoarchaeota archaeon]
MESRTEFCFEFLKNKLIVCLFFSAIFLVFSLTTVSAAGINDTLSLSIQTTFANGTIEGPNTAFVFDFNLTESSDAACLNPVYNTTLTVTTDDRAIASAYLPTAGLGGGNLSELDFDKQYYLCYYRSGTLKEVLQIGNVPYSFKSQKINLSEVVVDSNLTLGDYNVSASSGFFSFLGGLTSRVTGLFVQDIDASGDADVGGYLNVTGDTVVGGNVTASWFRGIFEWIVGSTSGNYITFNGTQLDFDESELNQTVDNKIGTNNDSVVNYVGVNNESVNNYIDSVAVGAYNDTWINQTIATNISENNDSIVNYIGIQNGSLVNYIGVVNTSMNNYVVEYVGIQNGSLVNYIAVQNGSLVNYVDLNNDSVNNNIVASIGSNNDSVVNYIAVVNTTRNNYVSDTFVPYTGASKNVDFGDRNLTVNGTTLFVSTNNGGRVGIGTLTPQNKLNLIGDLNATGSIYLGNVNVSTIDYVLIQNTSLVNYIAVQNGSLVNYIAVNNASVNNYIAANNDSVTNWVDSVFVQISNIVNLVGNWSADKADYYTSSEVDGINTSMKNYVDLNNGS